MISDAASGQRWSFGRGSGESVQLKFAGDGWVVVQPYEEVVLRPTE